MRIKTRSKAGGNILILARVLIFLIRKTYLFFIFLPFVVNNKLPTYGDVVVKRKTLFYVDYLKKCTTISAWFMQLSSKLTVYGQYL